MVVVSEQKVNDAPSFPNLLVPERLSFSNDFQVLEGVQSSERPAEDDPSPSVLTCFDSGQIRSTMFEQDIEHIKWFFSYAYEQDFRLEHGLPADIILPSVLVLCCSFRRSVIEPTPLRSDPAWGVSPCATV